MLPHNYCKSILPKVSRTFAINIAILNGDLYKATLCSYLLCRILDTVEDTAFVKPEVQTRLLDSFKTIFLNKEFDSQKISNWINKFFASAICREEEEEHYQLIRNTQLVVENFQTLSMNSQQTITHCIDEMAAGMSKMLLQKEAAGNNSCFLKTIDDLNEYCYYVAGTVGILATRLFTEYSKHFDNTTGKELDTPAVSLALGLQMTNIIKDCQRDYQRGVCYFPEIMLAGNGINSRNLFNPENLEKTRLIVNKLVNIAANHLEKAMDSILAFPYRAFRIRLSCLWPLFLAISTLVELNNNPRLLTGEKVRISRSEVKKIIRKTTTLGWSNQALKKYFNSYCQRLF